MRLLRGGHTEPARTPTEVADYVAHLPHGCALWMEAGGSLALSTEAHLLREAIFRLEVLDWHERQSPGPAPTRIELPRPAHEIRAEDAADQTKAQHYRARTARRNAQT